MEEAFIQIRPPAEGERDEQGGNSGEVSYVGGGVSNESLKVRIFIVQMKVQVVSLLFCGLVLQGICEGRNDSLEYVLIEGGFLYHRQQFSPEKIILHKSSLDTKVEADTKYSFQSCKNWNAHDGILHEYSIDDTPTMFIYQYRPDVVISLFQLDTEFRTRKYTNSFCSPLNMYKQYFNIEWKGYYKNGNRLEGRIPREEAIQKDRVMMSRLEADIFFKDSALYSLIGDPQGLYLWRSDSLLVTRMDEWKGVKAYTIKKLDWDYPPITRSPFKDQGTLYRTLKDPEMLKGNFKVFSQEGEIYFLNRISGKLYWLATKKVYELGEVDMAAYPELNERKVFIENRDAGELIFLSPVRWKKRLFKSVPLPKVSVMSKEEIAEKYPMLAGE
ncbi:hypothetical protein AAG747_11010 [Rapidithrix thailandica]|uniref:Uncharacterized protein n=1 Tax=Rapidithrix thailandica TaxID=413964 RepID=A0AAW9SC19_9BACT